MGEAKRRSHAKELGVPAQYREVSSGELRPAKYGGDLKDYFTRWTKGDPSPVPCNGCVTGCYHEHFDIYPEREKPEDFAHLLTDVAPDGQLELQHRPDGACIHLGENGCAIYEHLPHACRKYDCRVFPLFSLCDGMGGGRQTPMWIFDAPTRQARALQEAYRLCGLLAVAALERKGAAWTAEEALIAASRNVPEMFRALDALSRMTPQEIAEATGVDTSSMTEDEFLERSRTMMRRMGLIEEESATT